MGLFHHDDVWMDDVEFSGGLGSGPRRRRSVLELRRIVEEALKAGSVGGAGGLEVWSERESGFPVASVRLARLGGVCVRCCADGPGLCTRRQRSAA